MAKVLESFDFSRKGVKKKSKYPWDKWLNGDIWDLNQEGSPEAEEDGSDFDIPVKNFRTNLYVAARERGKGVHTRLVRNETGIVFQAYEAAEDDDSE